MPSTHKKVVVSKLNRDTLNGYVSPADFIIDGKVEVLNTSGNVVNIELKDIKGIYFVREFGEPESLRKTFTTRPRTEGLWVRLRFRDNEVMEGMMPNDLTLMTPDGYLINPPDTRSNTQRIFVPRTALAQLTVLAVIGAAGGRRRAAAADRHAPDADLHRISAQCTAARRPVTLVSPMKLSKIADTVGARLAGDDLEISGVAGIEEAGPGHLTFVANPKYAAAARTTRASAVIVRDDFPEIAAVTLRCGNPYLAFAKAIELFYHPPRHPIGIHSTAVVHPSAKIGKHASMGPYVVVEEDVEIGNNCVLLPHVVIYRGARIGDNFFAHAHAVVREFCRLGDNVILQNGVVIGADGFGFAKNGEGRWHKIVAVRTRGAGGRCRSTGQCMRRPGQRRRDPPPARRQDRQPGAGRPRLPGRREHAAVRAGRPGRVHRRRQQRDSRRAGRRRRPLHDWRRRRRHRAERHSQ